MATVIQTGLLQCSAAGVALEDSLETSIGPNKLQKLDYWLGFHLDLNTASTAVLVARSFLDPIQGVHVSI